MPFGFKETSAPLSRNVHSLKTTSDIPFSNSTPPDVLFSVPVKYLRVSIRIPYFVKFLKLHLTAVIAELSLS